MIRFGTCNTGGRQWFDFERATLTHITLHCYRIDAWAIRRPWLTFVNALANSILGDSRSTSASWIRWIACGWKHARSCSSVRYSRSCLSDLWDSQSNANTITVQCKEGNWWTAKIRLQHGATITDLPVELQERPSVAQNVSPRAGCGFQLLQPLADGLQLVRDGLGVGIPLKSGKYNGGWGGSLELGRW